MPAPKNARRNAEIVRLRNAGWAPCDIARLLHLSGRAVGSVLYRAGLCDPRNNPASPDMPQHVREAVSAGQRRAWADPAVRARRLAVLHAVKPWAKRWVGKAEQGAGVEAIEEAA